MELSGFVNISAVLQTGVYALVYRGEVLYVGKSKRMLGRVYTHLSMWGAKRSGKPRPSWLPVQAILFDEVHVQPCRPDQLDELESRMINLYKPKLNTQLKTSEKVSQVIALSIKGSTVHLNQPPTPAPRIERRV